MIHLRLLIQTKTTTQKLWSFVCYHLVTSFCEVNYLWKIMHLTLDSKGAQLRTVLWRSCTCRVRGGGGVLLAAGQQRVSNGSAFWAIAKHMGFNGSARVSNLFYKIYNIYFIKKLLTRAYPLNPRCFAIAQNADPLLTRCWPVQLFGDRLQKPS